MYDAVGLPTSVSTVIEVLAIDGEIDASARLQSAIDQAAAQPRDPVTGFRGAVQLGAGTFRVNSTLNMSPSVAHITLSTALLIVEQRFESLNTRRFESLWSDMRAVSFFVARATAKAAQSFGPPHRGSIP
jgi:hypothetical protein